ncbi:hypothetical protein VNO78_08419 [Psophocarpus tetragonolobus]|uniref:Transmembrane protein n=1 Tax=Psophocarpus tetragonolobus TaxID=3891 RepID=A0AAN9SX59_PSOTE
MHGGPNICIAIAIAIVSCFVWNNNNKRHCSVVSYICSPEDLSLFFILFPHGAMDDVAAYQQLCCIHKKHRVKAGKCTSAVQSRAEKKSSEDWLLWCCGWKHERENVRLRLRLRLRLRKEKKNKEKKDVGPISGINPARSPTPSKSSLLSHTLIIVLPIIIILINHHLLPPLSNT